MEGSKKEATVFLYEFKRPRQGSQFRYAPIKAEASANDIELVVCILQMTEFEVTRVAWIMKNKFCDFIKMSYHFGDVFVELGAREKL